MNVKDYVLGLLQPEDAWAGMFDGWKPGRNVSCAVAAENHEGGVDENPSMSLAEDGKAFCHSCGYKATNPIDVLADMEGIDFKEACREAYTRFVGPIIPESYVKACHEELMSNEYMQAVLEERRGITAETIKRFELGWDERRKRTVIPVRNRVGWCVNTRLHDTLGLVDASLKMKVISYGKRGEGYGEAHLWPEFELTKSNPVYIFEGEMDALLAHSLGVPSLSVTGGATTWREEWSRRLKDREVFIVPDADKAGKAGAAKKMESLAKRCKTAVVELPGLTGAKDDKDFTDWVQKHEGSADKLLGINPTKEKAPSAKDAEESGDEELAIFEETSAAETIDIKRSQAAWRWLKTRGAFFKNQDKELHYVMEGGATYRAHDRAEHFVAMLGNSISWVINTATRSGKFIIRHVLNRGMSEARDSKTGSFSLFLDDSIYLHCGVDSLAVAEAGEIKLIKNALNEKGVLLQCPDQVKALEPKLDAQAGKSVKMAWDCCFKLLPISQTNRYLVMCWWASLFLKEYIRPKPLLRFMASTAFGKSTATKMLSLLTYGEEILQSSATTTAALYAIARQLPMVFADNVETRNMTPAFEDFMLTAATGGGKSKRQMNTDSGVVWEETNCLVCTNGIEPVNKREIVSRTAEINVDISKYGTKGFHEVKVFQDIKDSRSEIVFGLVKLLSKDVVPRMKSGDVRRISRELGSHAKNRFDEHLGVMAAILDAIWPYVSDPTYGRTNDVVNAWLAGQNAAAEEQDEGTNEVLYYLSELAERGKGIADIRTKADVQKDGAVKIQGTTRELFTDFRVMARALNGKCPWQNERQLGTRINDAYGILKKAGWSYRSKILAGRRMNEFTKAGQAAKADAVRALDKGGVPRQGVQAVDVHAVKGQAKIPALRGVQPIHQGRRPGKGGR